MGSAASHSPMKRARPSTVRPGRPQPATVLHSGATIEQEDGPGQIPKRWRWHHQALVRLRERLIAERDRHLKEGAEPIEPHSMHQADAGTDQFDQDLALSLLSAEQDALYEVEAAIQRIADGTYGVCEQTQKNIPDARLRAVPWTRYLEEVEARHERAGEGVHPHLGTVRSVRREAADALAQSEPTVDEPKLDVPAEPPDEELPDFQAP